MEGRSDRQEAVERELSKGCAQEVTNPFERHHRQRPAGLRGQERRPLLVFDSMDNPWKWLGSTHDKA
eukprot:364875-Chlamydomonas_euryale.AAC.3